MAIEARAAGVRLLEQTAFDRLLEQDGRVVGVQAIDGRELRADLVLVAAGAWTPALLPHLAGVMWATGQPVVHFRVEHPAAWQAPRFPVWAADISRSGWYGFPALDDGTLKIANHGVGRRVHADDPRNVLPAEEARFRTFVRDHLPALADAPIVAVTAVPLLRHLRRRLLDRARSRASRLDRGRRRQRARVQVRAGAGGPDCRRGRGQAESVGAPLSLADERTRRERGGTGQWIFMNAATAIAARTGLLWCVRKRTMHLRLAVAIQAHSGNDGKAESTRVRRERGRSPALGD